MVAAATLVTVVHDRYTLYPHLPHPRHFSDHAPDHSIHFLHVSSSLPSFALHHTVSHTHFSAPLNFCLFVKDLGCGHKLHSLPVNGAIRHSKNSHILLIIIRILHKSRICSCFPACHYTLYLHPFEKMLHQTSTSLYLLQPSKYMYLEITWWRSLKKVGGDKFLFIENGK